MSGGGRSLRRVGNSSGLTPSPPTHSSFSLTKPSFLSFSLFLPIQARGGHRQLNGGEKWKQLKYIKQVTSRRGEYLDYVVVKEIFDASMRGRQEALPPRREKDRKEEEEKKELLCLHFTIEQAMLEHSKGLEVNCCKNSIHLHDPKRFF